MNGITMIALGGFSVGEAVHGPRDRPLPCRVASGLCLDWPITRKACFGCCIPCTMFIVAHLMPSDKKGTGGISFRQAITPARECGDTCYTP